MNICFNLGEMRKCYKSDVDYNDEFLYKLLQSTLGCYVENEDKLVYGHEKVSLLHECMVEYLNGFYPCNGEPDIMIDYAYCVDDVRETVVTFKTPDGVYTMKDFFLNYLKKS